MPRAAIVIPHFKTPDYLDICLRLLAHHTPADCEVIVVDNGSGPADLTVLDRHPDVVLIKRTQAPLELRPENMAAHAGALDAGIAASTAPLIVTLHADCFLFDPGWLDFLTDRLQSGPYEMAGPGTHKLRPPTWHDAWRRFWKRPPAGPGMIRPVFTIYRRSVFANDAFSNHPDVGGISRPYLETGHALVIPAIDAARYVFHLGGITRIVNLDHRPTAKRRKEEAMRRFLAQPEVASALSAP